MSVPKVAASSDRERLRVGTLFALVVLAQWIRGDASRALSHLGDEDCIRRHSCRCHPSRAWNWGPEGTRPRARRAGSRTAKLESTVAHLEPGSRGIGPPHPG